MSVPPIANQTRLETLFPISIAPPELGVFELGILLGGTVSAGAYTAGALDFLVQALEAWEQGLPNIPWTSQKPPHRVLVKGAAGTSGGAVCTAILGILSGHAANHITDAGPIESDKDVGNPLWDLWVNAFQISKLLSPSDVDPKIDVDKGTGVIPGDPPAGDGFSVQHVPSLLNCCMIDRAAEALVQYAENGPKANRPYFDKPFRVTTTFSNVRGIPFKIGAIPTYNQFTGAAFVEHDDIARFAFPNGAAYTADDKREDEFWIDPDGSGSHAIGYKVLADFATASGSMPAGLVARILSRPAEHYY